MSLSWKEKFENAKPMQIKKLEVDFSDMKKGEKMLISNPKDIAEYINDIPEDENRDIKAMRKDLASKYHADNTCPLTTGIFVRILAERSLELLAEGHDPIAPFWKVIDPSSPLARKISCGPEFIEKKRR